MKSAAFSYHRPTSLSEALTLLARYKLDAKVIAGGQSLVPMMNMRFAQPTHLIDLNVLPQLAGVRRNGDMLEIGAMTRHHELAVNPEVRELCPLLACAAATIGHYAIRQRGTIGGSLAHADPAAQLPLVACALDARIEVLGPDGIREIPAAEFLVSVMTTALEPDEIIQLVRFPCRRKFEGHAFELFSRRHGDFAIASCAVSVVLAGDTFAHIRIGLGGIADVPLVLDDLAASYAGRQADAAAAAELGVHAAEAIEPEDHREISSAYRRDLVKTLTQRALTSAIQCALQDS
ncbi:FAD binding domain-containing protein [Pararobbsia alpina]|uniref:Carbon monoxide dehydrogenase medium chain n=1 Tax=Pararobbsia alpina TaxID=621374 RepID=A0A6S7C4Z4_9BURK|nr:xanthine dehydrogenase family protein subunit M [Pararobbsia alpina]CAB3781332.1 Carbon monoxide dehydrogenase medium chain [Pararobbsia alpina]